MNVKELYRAIEAHQETCFHKRSCEVCSFETRDDSICDYCGNLVSYSEIYIYYCKCKCCDELHLCELCKEGEPHYEIIKDIENIYERGVYINDCCPITKAAK